MGSFHILTATEQVAGYLREELRRGTWHERMPGEDRLVAQLGVGRDTVKMALRSLEKEGLLVGQGVWGVAARSCNRRVDLRHPRCGWQSSTTNAEAYRTMGAYDATTITGPRTQCLLYGEMPTRTRDGLSSRRPPGEENTGRCLGGLRRLA